MRCISLRASLIVAAACLWAGVAWALINPRFTPKELFKQSQMILVVDVKEGNTKDEYLLTTRDVLKKGTTDEKVIRLDISKARRAGRRFVSQAGRQRQAWAVLRGQIRE